MIDRRTFLEDAEVTALLTRLTRVVLANAKGHRHEGWIPRSVSDINDGWCALWAALARRLVGGQLLATDSHVFLHRNGRFYDSERPAGVFDYTTLPFYDKGFDGPVHEVTAECAYEGWSGMAPFKHPPYNWLKQVHNRQQQEAA